MLTVRARRPILLLLAALITVLAAVGVGVTLAPAAHAARVQNRARASIPAAQRRVGPASTESPCLRPDQTVSTARIAVGFCVATEGEGSASLDTNALIRAVDRGDPGAIDSALAGRTPVVSPTAVDEYLVKGDQQDLDEFLNARGGRVGLPGTPEGAAALQAQAASFGRVLNDGDALIADGAMQEGIPIITNDTRFLRFLDALGYPAETH
jgi:predicted nucleic acid-binding protein